MLMLDIQMQVIDNLSYDRNRFRQEIIKSLAWLRSYEIIFLKKWLKEKYGESHKDIIADIFNNQLIYSTKA